MASNDFKIFARDLLHSAKSNLSSWFPAGKIKGNFFELGSIKGDAGNSLKVNLSTGVWEDFAGSDKGGDLLSLYAAHKSIKQGEALKELGGKFTSNKPFAKAKKPIKQKIIHKYNEDLEVHRVEYTDGTKDFFPRYKGKPGLPKESGFLRPLYHATAKGEGPKAPIYYIVEGEKAADAAAKHFKSMFYCITSMGGSKAYRKSDWNEIPINAKVIIHPDCDDVGYNYAVGVSSILSKNGITDIYILDVRANDLYPQNEGWDIADMSEDSMTTQQMIDWAKGIKKPHTDYKRIASPKGEIDKVKEKAMQEFSDQHKTLQFNKKGDVISSEANAYQLLKHNPTFIGKIYRDTFLRRNMYVKDGDPKDLIKCESVELEKPIITHVTITFQRMLGMPSFKQAPVDRAMMLMADVNKRSSAEEWLLSMKWDGEPRLDKFFTSGEYVCLSPQMEPYIEYAEAVGKNFFIGMVRRVLLAARHERGEVDLDYVVSKGKLKNMMILEGLQDVGKTKFFESVIRGQYYSAVNCKLDSKDFLGNSHGKMIINVDELASFYKIPAEKRKDVIEKTFDSFRMPYDRSARDYVRTAIFVGTTNNDDYLCDKTGNNRFWPIVVLSVNHEALIRDRDQLIAEAVVREAKGEPHWLVHKEQHEALVDSRDQSESEKDPWGDDIQAILEKNELEKSKFTVHIALSKILRIETSQKKSNDTARVTKALKDIGYVKKKYDERIGGKGKQPTYWYKKGLDPDALIVLTNTTKVEHLIEKLNK